MTYQAPTADYRGAAPVAYRVTNGVLQGTKVLTLDGEIPVDFLEIGDRVLTCAGASVLKSIEISVVTNARMIRISASTLGQERPEEDVLVPATQMVLVRDWRARPFRNFARKMCPHTPCRGVCTALSGHCGPAIGARHHRPRLFQG